MKTVRIVALIIVASIVLSTAGVGLYILLAHKDPVAPEVTQYNTLVGKFTDREIVDADSATLAVKDVAEDRHIEPFDSAFLFADGKNVKQSLGGMTVSSVTGIDDTAFQL